MKNNKIFLGIFIFAILIFSGCGKKEEIKVIESLQQEAQSFQESDDIQLKNKMDVVETDTKVINIDEVDKTDVKNSEDSTEEIDIDKDDDSLVQIEESSQKGLNDLKEDEEDDEKIKEEIEKDEGSQVYDDCIESGGIYNSIMEKCYYNGESEDGSSVEGNETDDPKAQKCIDEGGVYNSMLEECFK